MDVDKKQTLYLVVMLISTGLSGPLEVLKHEQSVDGLNGCFSLLFSVLGFYLVFWLDVQNLYSREFCGRRFYRISLPALHWKNLLIAIVLCLFCKEL